MKKPFQITRINIKKPMGSRKELLENMAKEKSPSERNKILQDAMYPNRLKRIEEGMK